MGFEIPVLTNAMPKILIVGESGSGKTHAALTFPNMAMIDSEGSAYLYRKKFEFLLAATKSVDEAMGLIDDTISGRAKINGKRVLSLGIDSATSFYETLQIAAMGRDGDISAKGWGAIKLLNAKLYEVLYTQTSLIVVVTAGVKPVFNGKTEKTTGSLVVDGEVIDADKKLRRAFDLIVKLYFDERTGKRSFSVLKARAEIDDWLPQGQRFEKPFSYEVVKEMLESFKDRPEAKQAQTMDEAIERDRKALERVNEENVPELLRKIGAVLEEKNPGMTFDDKKAFLFAEIQGHFDLQTRPEKTSQLTIQQLKWALQHFEIAVAA